MLQVASLRYDVIFKKAFSKLHIFTGFVQDITGIKLEIDHVETEKEFAPPVGRVQSRFDLYAEDKKNRIIVDIQHVRYPDHYHRFLHYHCAAILEQAANANDYRAKARVLTIVLLTSSDRYQKDVTRIDFDPKDLQGRGLNEVQHQILYLAPPYVTEATPEPYKQWLTAIDDSLDGVVDETAYTNPIIQEIFHIIEDDKISPKERFRMKDEFGYEEIKRDKFQEWFNKGEAKGKAELLRRLIIRRFKQLPDWADERIDNADIGQLDVWVEAIFDAGTIQDLLNSTVVNV